MRSKTGLLVLLVAFFLLFVDPVAAQQGSLYFSVGDNMSRYNSSTIHIEQSELGNSYNFVNVKGNDKTNTPIGALNLNYRLGFYCNDVQDLGLELNFDPVNYTVADGQKVTINGVVNNILNVQTSTQFSRANGSYYYFDGLNLFLVNLVKRWGVYRAVTNNVAVDILGKGGIGPVLPHFHSKLSVNPVDDPQLDWAGWNYGFEAAVRVSIYRYCYFEFAGKYDYAMMEGMQVYQGTATQNLATYEAIASFGFTFPTTRFNPLFHHEKRIITILPWYQHIDELGGEGAKGKKDDAGEGRAGSDSLGIPEFQDIVNNGKKYNLDSLAAADSVEKNEPPKPDSAAAPQPKKHRRHKRDSVIAVDNVAASMDSMMKAPDVPDTAKKAPAVKPEEQKTPELKAPEATKPEAQDTTKKAPELSKKEKKKLAREEKKAAKEKAKEEKAEKKKEEKAEKETPDNKDKPPGGQ